MTQSQDKKFPWWKRNEFKDIAAIAKELDGEGMSEAVRVNIRHTRQLFRFGEHEPDTHLGNAEQLFFWFVFPAYFREVQPDHAPG